MPEPRQEPKRNRPAQPPLASVAEYLGYGLTFALSTALFLFLGWLVDRWLGTMPLFLILGAFVGAGAGFYSLYYHMVVEPKRRRGDADRGEREQR